MVRYFVADSNVVGIRYESGTWASPSGSNQWIGMVQANDIDESTGVIASRFVGNASRNVSYFADGPKDVTGKLTFYPVDWRVMLFGLGKCADSGSPSPYSHAYTEANSSDSDKAISGQVLPSFTIEDYHVVETGSNFGRVIRGAMVDKLTVSAAEGEQTKIEVDYVGKDWDFASGAYTAFEASGTWSDTTRSGLSPFMWSHWKLQMPSGTVLNEVKDFTISVDNKLDRPHYLNGSRYVGALIPTERNYMLDLTVNATTDWAKSLYETYFVSGGEFNVIMSAVISAGSRDAYFTFSGCKMIDMSDPTKNAGTQEQKLTIQPKTCSVTEASQYQFNNIGSYA